MIGHSAFMIRVQISGEFENKNSLCVYWSRWYSRRYTTPLPTGSRRRGKATQNSKQELYNHRLLELCKIHEHISEVKSRETRA